MASQDYPDPLTDWFRRNRHWVALTLWLILLLGGVDELLTEGLNGVISFAHRFFFFGLLCWQVGSHRDRNTPEFWSRFIAGWSAILVAEGLVILIAALRGNFSPATLLTLLFGGLLLGQCVWSYRRTRRGLTWNRQPAGA